MAEPGEVEAAVRAELRSLTVPVATVRGRTALALARKLDDPATSAAGASAVALRLGQTMDAVRSLRVPAPEVGGDEEAPAVVVVPDAVARARAAREARQGGGAGG